MRILLCCFSDAYETDHHASRYQAYVWHGSDTQAPYRDVHLSMIIYKTRMVR